MVVSYSYQRYDTREKLPCRIAKRALSTNHSSRLTRWWTDFSCCCCCCYCCCQFSHLASLLFLAGSHRQWAGLISARQGWLFDGTLNVHWIPATTRPWAWFESQV